MTPFERRYLACVAAIEAWLNAVSPSRAIAEAFDDEGLKPTEAEISVGLDAVRHFKIGPGSKESVSAACAA